MNLSAPEEFKSLCRNLVQGTGISAAEEFVQASLAGIDRRDYPAIKAFLDELLSGRYSGDELVEYWSTLPSDIFFYEGQGVVRFLTMLRDRVSNPA